jgi:hypothetical protein
MPKSSPLAKQVKSIRASLRRLEGDLRRLVPVLATATHASVGMPKASGPRRKLRLSPERRRALKLQGRYLGYMRQLKLAQKARVKAVKAKKGMHAAIAMARKMANG